MSDSKTSSGGIGFLGILAIVFITLKLCKVIEWSWWWVTCPLWGPAAIVFVFLAIKFAAMATSALFEDRAIKQRRRDQMKMIKNDMKRANDLKVSGKSQWQIRLEEMQKQQSKAKNY
jgi:hypothetical protein